MITVLSPHYHYYGINIIISVTITQKTVLTHASWNSVRLFPEVEVNGTGRYPGPSTDTEGNSDVSIYQTSESVT